MEQSENLFAGFDIGSDSIHYAVLDANKNILHSPKPIPHLANPTQALKQAWEDITTHFNQENIQNTAFTGSGSKSFLETMQRVTYDYDSVTIPKGAKIIQPDVESVFHIGAKDAYFFSLANVNGEGIIREARPSSKCGGGSGTLVAKQCRRLLEAEVSNPEDIFTKAEEMARTSQDPSKFLARCGIVVQSDLIHKQNEGVSKEDNLAGLFETTARNYIIDVLGNKELSQTKAIATGGVMANSLIKENLENLTGIKIERPNYFENIGAIGIAAKGIEDNNNFVFSSEQLDEVKEQGQAKRKFAPALSLENVNERSEKLEDRIKTGTEVVLGIDGGSTTTKGALVDLSGKLLDKLYIPTHGDPEGSLKEVLTYLSRHKDNVTIKGVATTGSARQLYQRILVNQAKAKELGKGNTELIDRVTDEITCHALGVKHNDPEVDTIYEIGGQDMKYTEFNEDGTVKEAKMNFSCQAGGGQTLENMASIIGLDVTSTLQEEAFKAKRIPLIDPTCGVFMEMDLNRLISEGFSKPELAAAIIHATAASYYHKFVGGNSGTTKNSSVQGGPALGKAFLAALAQVSEDKVNAYPHREMFGAWGAALDVINNIKTLEEQAKPYDTAFRGWEVMDMEFNKDHTTCQKLSEKNETKKCKVRDCDLEVYSIGDDTIITGGFCPIGNSEAVKKPKTNYVDKFHNILENHFQKYGALLEDVSINDDNTIGIRRCTSTIGEKGIWSAALLNNLGLTPVLTPKSNHDIARIGIDNSRTEFCMARKLATGHASLIRDHLGVEYSFNPSIIQQVQEQGDPMKYCIYTESEGFILNDDLSLDKNKMINPIIEFGDNDSLTNTFYTELKRIGKGTSKRKIRQAIEKANQAEHEFNQNIFEEGDKFTNKTRDEIAYIGIGRDYVLLDPEASSNSGTMFAQTRGLNYIPQTFIKHQFENQSIHEIAPDEYWHESRDIIQAQMQVANKPSSYPIRMINFGCGPDSMKIYQEEKIQRDAGKPMLVLLTDGQTNNAPFVTRTEAYERVVNQHYAKNKKEIYQIQR